MERKRWNAEGFFTHPLGMVVAATAATFLWGSAFPFILLSYNELQIQTNEYFMQILFAGYRFFLAALLIMVFAYKVQGDIRYQKGTLRTVATVGTFQTFLQYVFFYIGMSYSTGIQGSVIAGTTTFFQMLVAHFMFRDDKLNMRKIAGMVIGFLGVIIVNLGKSSGGAVNAADQGIYIGIGSALLLGAMFCGGLGNVLVKKYSNNIGILYITGYQMLFGSVALIVVGASQVGLMPFTWTVKSASILIYLAFLSACGFVLWNYVMKFNQVSKVSLFLFFIPVFGVLLSAVLLREVVHATALIALLLVVMGIVIVNRGAMRTHSKNDQSTFEER